MIVNHTRLKVKTHLDLQSFVMLFGLREKILKMWCCLNAEQSDLKGIQGLKSRLRIQGHPKFVLFLPIQTERKTLPEICSSALKPDNKREYICLPSPPSNHYLSHKRRLRNTTADRLPFHCNVCPLGSFECQREWFPKLISVWAPFIPLTNIQSPGITNIPYFSLPL